MLEKVIVLNVPRRVDKKIGIYGSLRTLGFPDKMITFYEGKDNAEYESFEAIRQEAMADGFTHFEPMHEEWQHKAAIEGWNIGMKGGLCCTWSLQRIYRDLLTSKGLTLVMVDDVLLPTPYADLSNMISRIDGVIDIFQLFHISAIEEGIKIDSGDTYERMPAYPNLSPHDRRVSIGLAGIGDNAIIMSAKGAEMILEHCTLHPFWTVELVMYFLAKQNPPNCYSLNHHCFNWSGQLELKGLTGNSDTEIELGGL